MRTTLTLDEDVARKLESEARRTGRSFKSVVNEALRLGLLRTARPTAKKPFRIHPHPLALRAGIDLSNVEELFDRLDHPARER